MGFCYKCGKNIDGEGLCTSCSMPTPTYAAPDLMANDFPCQRCGMYLPKTELQMWNSRLYCNYCIMDLKDEEQRMKRPLEAPVAASGRAVVPEYRSRESCQRCGRQVDRLYTWRGKRLCITCMTDESGTPATGGAGSFSNAIRAIWGIGRKESAVAGKIRIKNAQGPSGKGMKTGADDGMKTTGSGIAAASRKSMAGADGKPAGLFGRTLALLGFGRGKSAGKAAASTGFEAEKDRSEFEEIGQQEGGTTGRKFSVKRRKFVAKERK